MKLWQGIFLLAACIAVALIPMPNVGGQPTPSLVEPVGKPLLTNIVATNYPTNLTGPWIVKPIDTLPHTRDQINQWAKTNGVHVISLFSLQEQVDELKIAQTNRIAMEGKLLQCVGEVLKVMVDQEERIKKLEARK